MRFALGMDCGKQGDPSALALIEALDAQERASIASLRGRMPPPLRLRHLQRLPLGMEYHAQADYVLRFMARPPLLGQTELIVDRTGGGIPVVEIFQHRGAHPLTVTIHGGLAELVSDDGRDFGISKQALVDATLKVLRRRLISAPRAPDGRGALPEWTTLVQEFVHFVKRPTKKPGRLAYGAVQGKHDDLVLAFAMACWRMVRLLGL